MVTTAFVGAGHIHTPGFVKRIHERDDVTVKYVWDHDSDRAAKYATEEHSSEKCRRDFIHGDHQEGTK